MFNRKKGFTLIDLVLVATILGIMLSFLIPIIAEKANPHKGTHRTHSLGHY